jgi:hypothetical protein
MNPEAGVFPLKAGIAFKEIIGRNGYSHYLTQERA